MTKRDTNNEPLENTMEMDKVIVKSIDHIIFFVLTESPGLGPRQSLWNPQPLATPWRNPDRGHLADGSER